MRVVYYTHTAYLDPALSFIREMAQRVELHVLLEVSPAAWQLASFDVPRQKLPSGIVVADPVLRNHFPAGVRSYWQDAASFHLVVHNARKFVHPGSWRVSHEVIGFLRKLKPTLLHVDSAPLRLGLVVPEWPAVPVVLSEHDPEPHSGEHDWRTHLARWLTYPRVDRFILHNAALRAAFGLRYKVQPERITVAHLGPYDLLREWVGQPLAPEHPTVLFFGRLSRYKGLDLLFRAAPRVAARVPGVRFVVAGRPVRGYQPPHPPALANSGRVDVLDGYVSNSRLAELFQRATVVACPYTDATQSGVLLTAYAFLKPVVATRIGGLPEYISDGESSLLTPPGDPEALASGLVRVLCDASLRHRLTDGIAARVAADLSWSRLVDAMLTVYEAARSGYPAVDG